MCALYVFIIIFIPPKIRICYHNKFFSCSNSTFLSFGGFSEGALFWTHESRCTTIKDKLYWYYVLMYYLHSTSWLNYKLFLPGCYKTRVVIILWLIFISILIFINYEPTDACPTLSVYQTVKHFIIEIIYIIAYQFQKHVWYRDTVKWKNQIVLNRYLLFIKM